MFLVAENGAGIVTVLMLRVELDAVFLTVIVFFDEVVFIVLFPNASDVGETDIVGFFAPVPESIILVTAAAGSFVFTVR